MRSWYAISPNVIGLVTVLKPASPTPWSILKLMEVVGDILPPGTLNIVNGPGAEVGMALARPCALAGDDQSRDHLR